MINSNSCGIYLSTLVPHPTLSEGWCLKKFEADIPTVPTHFHAQSNPSCIDLIVCAQPNLRISSGMRPSLKPSCKLNINPPPPPLAPSFNGNSKQIFKNSNTARKSKLIEKAVSEFPWELNLVKDEHPQFAS